MRKSRFTEEQIIKVLKKHAAGLSAGLCRKYGISDATFYKWRSRYGGMEVSDARKLKVLDDENRRLKKLLAESIAPERFADMPNFSLAPRAPSIHGTSRCSLHCSGDCRSWADNNGQNKQSKIAFGCAR